MRDFNSGSAVPPSDSIKYNTFSFPLYLLLYYFLTLTFIMRTRELCIECGRNKAQEKGTYFCQKCKDKIINNCWNYH